ncbi:response regulator transcription factor [Bacillaceae bacterium IKA-2]|nr:response regulator transcription factor [Bacillaceae bacterium IKA-2]
MVKVLLVEDHPAMGYGTKTILEQMPNIEVVGIAESGEKGIEMVEQYQPEIIFLDMNLPDKSGKEVAKIIKEKHPKKHIIIFTGYDYRPYVNDLIGIGVSGLMMKSATPKQLLRMIDCVIDGETVIPLTLFRHMQINESAEQKIVEGMKMMTKREKKVLSMIAKGNTNKGIAEEIDMSVRSIEYCITSIYEKLEVNSRAKAIEKYVRETN